MLKQFCLFWALREFDIKCFSDVSACSEVEKNYVKLVVIEKLP